MVKRYNTAIILLFFLISAVCFSRYADCDEQNPGQEIRLSLKEAILLGFKNNKGIQTQEEEIKAVGAGIMDAQSRFMPNLSINAGYTHNSDVLKLSSTTSTKKDIGIFSGYKNDNKAGVVVEQPIYAGGVNTANLKQAKLNLRVSEETLRAKRLDLEFDIRRLYFGLLLAYETERNAEELINQAKSHYEDVKNKFAQGTSSKFDLLQSKVQVSKIIPELVKARNAVDLIAAELKVALGLKITDALSLRDKLEYSPIEIKENEFLKAAYLDKPEMTLKALGIDLSKWSIEMAKAGFRPQVNANLAYNYRSNNISNMFNNRHANWDAGFTVTIPLFDGFSTRAKVDEARARYMQAALEKEDLADRIAVDIRKACLDLKEASSIIDSSKDNIEEASEALKISEVIYDNGAGTNLDVLDAQVSLSQVKKNFSEAIYDYLVALAYLDRAMGRSFLMERKRF